MSVQDCALMATVAKSPRLLRTTLGIASAGPFSLGFRVFDTDGFEVYVNGAVQTVTTDYTISASFTDGYDDAATITFTSALSAGDVLLVYGQAAADRGADYINGDANLTAKLNIELARQAAMLVEVQRDTPRAFQCNGPHLGSRATDAGNPGPRLVAGETRIFNQQLGLPVE